MNEKEISEIRRRFRKDKSNISHVFGCFVNEKQEIVSEFCNSLGLMPQNESEELLAILKKSLSGSLGKNLINIEFSTKQVMEDDEHKLLMKLKKSELGEEEALHTIFEKIAASVKIEGKYLILMSCDKYDVPAYTKDGGKAEDSSDVFTYFVCCVCPVKLVKPALSYHLNENKFCNISADWIISAPELGFMFPSFDDRCSNIYNTLFYTKNTSADHSEFINNVFKSEMPMPAEMQKETFRTILEDTVSDDCSYEVVQAVHDQISGMIAEHKESKEEEPLVINKKTVKNVLESCGVKEEKVSAFEEKYDLEFGENADIVPGNIVDTKSFELKTPDITIKVNPERSDLVKTQIIDGTKYIMIRADDNVEVNGVNIHISE